MGTLLKSLSLPLQEPLVTSVWMDVEVLPLSLEMSPLDQHVDEGGRISVTCTAYQVAC
jgi:hypothetical protein